MLIEKLRLRLINDLALITKRKLYNNLNQLFYYKEATKEMKSNYFNIKKIRLLITFYKSFTLTNFLITFICLGILYGFGAKGIYMIQALFWFKMITLAITFYAINEYKKNEFYYYKNLGISKLNLWLPILIFDFLFFLIALITLASYLHDPLPGN